MTRPVWTPAYIGLGSNLADPAAQVKKAILELDALPDSRVTDASRLVQSAPLGPADQPDYVNAVAVVLTQLSALQLLGHCQAIETRHQRQRDPRRWGPRTLDLDLLVYGAASIDHPDLTVPHPGIARRAFVLGPLCEVAPALHVPGLGSVAKLAARCDLAGLAALSEAVIVHPEG